MFAVNLEQGDTPHVVKPSIRSRVSDMAQNPASFTAASLGAVWLSRELIDLDLL